MIRGAFAALALALAGAVAAHASASNVHGRVVDADNLPLPGAAVTLRPIAGGPTRAASTDADGRYRSIEISSLKKDLQVRARKGYFAPQQ